jgi:hypothetical protein
VLVAAYKELLQSALHDSSKHINRRAEHATEMDKQEGDIFKRGVLFKELFMNRSSEVHCSRRGQKREKKRK